MFRLQSRLLCNLGSPNDYYPTILLNYRLHEQKSFRISLLRIWAVTMKAIAKVTI